MEIEEETNGKYFLQCLFCHQHITRSFPIQVIFPAQRSQIYLKCTTPMGCPWALHGSGEATGVSRLPALEKKEYLYFVFMLLCICSYFVFVFAFCNCVFACPPKIDSTVPKPHEPMLPCPDINCHTKCVVLPADTNLGAEWSGLDILRTTAWSYSLYRFISCFFLFLEMHTSI